MNKIENIVVAKIIKDGQIVINKGAEDGIKQSMEFVVYEDGGLIVDPTTQKGLGNLEKPKGEFRVFDIQDKMTVLLSKKNLAPPKKVLNITTFSSDIPQDDEVLLIKSIQVGDKCKIINKAY